MADGISPPSCHTFLDHAEGRVKDPEYREARYREALEGFRRVLGNDHPDTLISIANMGSLYTDMGDYAEAEPYFREALEGHRRVLGDGHHMTLRQVNNMGFLLNKLGRYEEAAKMLKESEPAARRVWTRPGPGVLGNYLAKLGEAQIGLGQYADAEATILEAFQLQHDDFDKDPARRIGAINQLVRLYEAWHGAEPGQGYDAKAAEWRAKLPEEEAGDAGE